MLSMVSLVLSLVAASAGTSGNTYCKPPESPIFSCDLGKKRVSVCAGDGLLTYRYGAVGEAVPEMQISSNGKDGRVHSDSVVGGGGKQTSLRFSNGDAHYIVFSGYAGSLTDSPGKRWSGLDVLNGSMSVRNRQCGGTGEVVSLASSSIPAFVPTDEENGPFSGWR